MAGGSRKDKTHWPRPSSVFLRICIEAGSSLVARGKLIRLQKVLYNGSTGAQTWEWPQWFQGPDRGFREQLSGQVVCLILMLETQLKHFARKDARCRLHCLLQPCPVYGVCVCVCERGNPLRSELQFTCCRAVKQFGIVIQQCKGWRFTALESTMCVFPQFWNQRPHWSCFS